MAFKWLTIRISVWNELNLNFEIYRTWTFNYFYLRTTAWKVPKYRACPYFSAFGPNTEIYSVSLHIQSKWTRKNSVLGHFSRSEQYLKYLKYNQNMPDKSKYIPVFFYSKDLPEIDHLSLIRTNLPRNEIEGECC